jgi:hypothetical protein
MPILSVEKGKGKKKKPKKGEEVVEEAGLKLVRSSLHATQIPLIRHHSPLASLQRSSG